MLAVASASPGLGVTGPHRADHAPDALTDTVPLDPRFRPALVEKVAVVLEPLSPTSWNENTDRVPAAWTRTFVVVLTPSERVRVTPTRTQFAPDAWHRLVSSRVTTPQIVPHPELRRSLICHGP